MSENFIISSYVARIASEQFDACLEALASLENVEVPVTGEAGKVVILVESQNTKTLMEITEKIQSIAGIVSFLPVYHHDETGL